MPKIPHYDRCLNNAHRNYLCAMHPEGASGDSCPDFAGNGWDLWCPEGYKFVDEQLVKLPVTYETNHAPSITRSQQLQIFMTHPMFTGLCLQCRYIYVENSDRLNWNCPMCGWRSD